MDIFCGVFFFSIIISFDVPLHMLIIFYSQEDTPAPAKKPLTPAAKNGKLPSSSDKSDSSDESEDEVMIAKLISVIIG